MAWPENPRPAKSLLVLRDEVDHAHPNRLKTDDGMLGDDAHAARTSDHNPDSNGVVCALDLTHDPAHGFDSYDFGDVLRQNKDQRVKYVISNRRIFYGPRHGGNPDSLWKWEPYSGENPHDKHIHISVGDPRYYDETELWNITAAPQPPDAELPTLQRGDTGKNVQTVQKIIFVDGVFGPVTEQGVKDFQSAHGLAADGIVGRMTWAALLGTSGGVPTGDWQAGITATVFGGVDDPNNSAYDGHRITDSEMGASLPARVEGNRVLDIRNEAGKTIQATVVDIGPWLVDDPYWQTGTRPIAEDVTKPLPRGPNKGRRSNGAGIDLTPAVAKALGIDGRGKVDWKFHTTETAQPVVAAPVDATRGKPVMNGNTVVAPQQAVVAVQPAVLSKVNWMQVAGIIASGATLLSSGKLDISPETVAAIIGGIQAVVAVATIIFRTYFNTTITPSSAKKI